MTVRPLRYHKLFHCFVAEYICATENEFKEFLKQ